MRRDIEVANRKEDEVSEGLQTPESRAPVLDDLEQAIDTLAHGMSGRAPLKIMLLSKELRTVATNANECRRTLRP